jgi:signal transduction histidine kinase
MDEEFKDPGGEENFIKIDVKDTGIGISNENLQKLFMSFGKLKDSNSLNENGCGLGLNICKRISQSMGGDIIVKSILGLGSTFSFIFKFKIFKINQGNIM